jgi:WD40 repeat protein
MTIQRDLQHQLRAHFEERADRTVIDGQLAAILDTTARRRQRPAWLAALRSPSMTVITLERPTTPRVAWTVVALALLILALVAAFLVAGIKLPGPPANGQIVFGRMNAALGDTEVFVMNPDGSHVRQLLPGTYEGPFWSPDGSQIGLGHSVINANGTGLRTWNQQGNAFHIECWDWSPDGKRMLCEGFSDDQAADLQIHGVYTVRASDGGDLFRLSATGDGGIPGTYSPDGSMAAYTGTIDGIDGALIVVRSDGTQRHRLGKLISLSDPRWAPDGQSILVVSQGTLFSVDVATGKATRLRIKDQPATDIYGGQWSPDGTRLLIKLFVSNNNLELYTMAADGTDLVQLTFDPDDDRFFDWGTHPLER